MARPHPTQNVSFKDNLPPSRRAGRDDQPPPPPSKSPSYSKASLVQVPTNTSGVAYNAGSLGYDDGYLEAGSSNMQGFSASNGADVRRKKSMVKPERERIDPGHRLWHYREHAQEDQMNVMPSCELSPTYHADLSYGQPTVWQTWWRKFAEG